jgi:hypothetical protein
MYVSSLKTKKLLTNQRMTGTYQSKEINEEVSR